ncbi:MAG: hypothetical protein JXA25_02315 [Anaerolineales bacterium]|nr:hypothetical protein [Anaerolineales bacterium]
MGITFQVLEEIQKAGSTLTLDQLARSLFMERSALEKVIEFWIRKGKIIRVNNMLCTANCGQCSKPCSMAARLPEGLVQYQVKVD